MHVIERNACTCARFIIILWQCVLNTMLSRAMFSFGDKIDDCMVSWITLDSTSRLRIKDRAHHTEVNATGEVRKLLCWTPPLDLSFVSM